MDKGATKACPRCRKIVVFKANYEGKGTEEMKCPYCQVRLLKKVNMATLITLEIIGLILILVISGELRITLKPDGIIQTLRNGRN